MSATRRVIVTGGSRGLGASLVREFLEAGDRVATCSRAPTAEIEGWAAQRELDDRFHYEALDLADRACTAAFVANVFERWGGIDVLVNNAGVAHAAVLGLIRDEEVDALLDLNLRATIQLTKLVVRHMLVQGGGRVINISSIVGISGYRGLSVYSATKAALDGFTRALARELGSRGITVNSVAPGYLRTELTHGLTEEQLEQIARRTPLGRLGEPGDIAAAVKFLVSPGAGFITGHVLVVDGGLTA
jgi:3-oxoacyl-[acyl-carrier protein] reductase